MPLPKEEHDIRKVSAKQKVYEMLKEWIIEGQLRPGEKISDGDIAALFHVSRTPVREALLQLEMQKLVKSYPGRSTVVSELEYENIEKWYAPMACLQQLAVGMAVENAGEANIARLKELNERFAVEVREKNDVLNIFEADREFHSYIIEMSGNEYILDFCNTLWIHVQRLEYCFFKDGTSLEESISDHEQMIKAFERKDGFTAGLKMKNNWERTVVQIQSMNHLKTSSCPGNTEE